MYPDDFQIIKLYVGTQHGILMDDIGLKHFQGQEIVDTRILEKKYLKKGKCNFTAFFTTFIVGT